MSANPTPASGSWRLHTGDPNSGVILHVPHSSRVIPADIRADIELDDSALVSELLQMTDAHTDLIAQIAAGAALVRPWIFENAMSRLVIDPERFPDEREEMERVGMGAVYTRTSDGKILRDPSPHQRSELIANFFAPYSAAFADAVQERLDTCGDVTIIDVHSFPLAPLPYELHADGARPDVCLGTHPIHTPPWLVDAARQAFTPMGCIDIDSPFVGTYVPLVHYEVEPRVHSIMIEMRRDRYMDESTGEPLAALIQEFGRCLAALVDAAATEEPLQVAATQEPLMVAATPKPLTEMSDAEIDEWARTAWESMTGKQAK